MDSLYFAAGGEEGGAPEIPQQLPGNGGMAQAIGRGSEDEEVCSETLRVTRLSLHILHALLWCTGSLVPRWR